MRERGRLRLGATTLLLGACALVACVGGGGSLPDGAGSWEGAPSSVEAAGSSTEGALISTEPPGTPSEAAASGAEPSPGAQPGGGAATCAGRFRCEVPNVDAAQSIELISTSAGCVVAGDDDDVVLTPDGNVREDGKVIGSWSSTGSTLTISVRGFTISCVRSSDPGSGRPPRPEPDPPPRPSPPQGGEGQPDLPSVPDDRERDE